MHLALLLLALGLVLVLLGLIDRGGVQLGLGDSAHFFFIVVHDKVVGSLGVNHQLDRGFVFKIVHFGEERRYLIKEFFVSHGAAFFVDVGISEASAAGVIVSVQAEKKTNQDPAADVIT